MKEKPKSSPTHLIGPVALRAVDSLTPYKRNAKIHDDEQIDALANQISAHGFDQPIVVDADGVIIKGHGRLLAAKKLGMKLVPVIVRNDLTPAQVRAARIADNKLAETGWDDDMLREEFRCLQTFVDFDVCGLTGFSDREIQKILNSSDGQDQEDDAPDARVAESNKLIKKYGIEPGQLWALGDQRIMCGDSANPVHVSLLMGKDAAALMATDPPYGVAYGDETGQGNKFGTIANDENNGPKLQAFLESVFKTWLPHLREDAAWYLWHAQMTQGFFAAAAAAAAADVIIHRQIIWVKPSLVLGHGDFHWRHELCFYGWRQGHRAPWFGDRKQTTVWEVGRENDGIHPTQKPVDLFTRPIRFNTREGDVCAEPFSGSGTSLIACEKTGRKCRAMEIDPAYVAVAIQRWVDLTGGTPKLIKK